jgi:hypothetical protein
MRLFSVAATALCSAAPEYEMRSENTLAQQPHNSDRTISQLENSSPPKLRACWRETFKAPAPEISPNLMRHAIAYRLQGRRHPKLPASQLRQIAKFQKKLISNGTLEAATSIQLSAGMQLIRKWNGTTHVVLVLDDAFEYDGTLFSSLTKIAQFITGAHWSGPRFFGLKRSSMESSTNV